MPTAIDDVTLPQSLPNSQRRESDASQGRRRSSASSAGRFSSLNYHKRQMSEDAAAAARRESFNDQRKESGWLGGLWNNWVRGPNQPAVDQRRRGSVIDPAAETTHTTSVAEEVQKAPWGSKHISGTGSGAAAFRAQYPRSNSRD